MQQGSQQGVESGNNFHPQLGIELKILVLTLNRILNHLGDCIKLLFLDVVTVLFLYLS